MKTRVRAAFLIGGMVAASLLLCTPALGADEEWLATGTVTRIGGPTFYLLGKDNLIYRIDAARSEVLVEDFSTDCYSLRVGDKVRVFGRVAADGVISAKRVRVFSRGDEWKLASAGAGPQKEITVILQKRDVEPPPEAAPVEPPPAQLPQPCPCWEGRGLITDFDYTAKRIKLQTPTGAYSINTDGAAITNGRTRIGFGLLNIGDAVVVSGTYVGPNEIDAQQVEVRRTYSEAQNALPLQPLTLAGVIQNVDYASMTLKMQGTGPGVVVSCDEETQIEDSGGAVSFAELRPGMRIKMRGNGSLASGYSARHIRILGAAP